MQLQFTLKETGFLFDCDNPDLNIDKIKQDINKKGYCQLPNKIRPAAVLFPTEKIRWDIGVGFSQWDWWFDLPNKEQLRNNAEKL